MRRKRKKRTGISLLLLALALLPGADAAKKKAENDSYAIIEGTVFRDPGFALPNAVVTLTPDPRQTAAAKIKKMQTVSNSRGEFVLHVPPFPFHYTVKATAKGFQDQEKAITVQGEDRVEVTFSLHGESK